LIEENSIPEFGVPISLFSLYSIHQLSRQTTFIWILMGLFTHVSPLRSRKVRWLIAAKAPTPMMRMRTSV
jgi:hypothetical protein